MDPRFTSAVLLILSCWLWNAECREPNKILTVKNGERFGEWGKMAMCPEGYANGFSLKVQPSQGINKDDTGLNGIRLHCAHGEIIESLTGEDGEWGEAVKCSNGNLMSFMLKVEEYQGLFDDTAVNNIKFTCQDQEVLRGSSKAKWGTYGEWSAPCDVGAICGVKTKVEMRTEKKTDYTGLNDARFACCD
ncbi:vitelline membrane outer layer protein 1-like [Thamnophis elegans]|uniref:vitelline membrane outer layer protein 1-like n=1 Tax=Thamnophis elegans TaxID=35005 RepID=UPI00137798A2|nr:vitelline membrane outer layer protein 1-like [Thamnophis elegans]XP_032076133.1 vitelline membrane outer layer protein 1-like [Thamnophis elegans]